VKALFTEIREIELLNSLASSFHTA